MTTIRLTFPGRYHATPWGRHVNEGVPEWPPSPYRLLRALYDVWKRKCAEIPAEDVREVLEALATGVPRFQLPRTAATHTKSYLSANALDPADKNLVFDSFLALDRTCACYVSWSDLVMQPRAQSTLALLLGNLNFLGRSESWIDAQLWDRRVEGSFNCDPATAADNKGDLMRVACVLSPLEFAGGSDWMEALTFSTSTLLKERASAPPLLKPVAYVRASDAIEMDPLHQEQRRPQMIQAVILGLDGVVLPLVTTTLEVAEQIRVRLMGAHKRRMGGDETRVSPLFSGKTIEGEKRLDHGHVYILPIGNRDGRIDRVRIVSPLEPFVESELDAIRGVKELWQRDNRAPVRCVVTWQGAADEQMEKSLVVESATPFVPPRHWRKGRDFKKFLFEEVERECQNHRIPRPVEIELLERMPNLFHEVEYRRNRKQDPVRPGFALRLRFDREIDTPFAIGYGAHFGLGQFRASLLS